MAGRVMYGRDEYRYYVNRIDHERDVLTGVREAIELLLEEYRNDTRATFTLSDEPMPTRVALIAARVKISEAMDALDRAQGALPKAPERDLVADALRQYPFQGAA